MITFSQWSMVRGQWGHPLWLVIILFCLLTIPATSFSQKISVTLDRDKIVLGEQVSLQLKVEEVNARASFITQWFTLADSVNHINILKREPEDTVDVGGLNSYVQHITITSFDSGRWAIPLSPIIIQDRATGKKTTLEADSVFLQVLPVDVSALKDYHDIKEIIDVPAETNYTLIIAAAVSVVLIAVLLVLLLRRKKKPAAKPGKPVSKLSPLEEALLKIKELEKEELVQKGQLKLFYTKLDEICRQYFTRKMQVNAMHLTSDEIMLSLVVYLQDRQAKTRYYQLLRLTDAVKFAKYLPVQDQHDEALAIAATTLQHIDFQIQTPKHVN